MLSGILNLLFFLCLAAAALYLWHQVRAGNEARKAVQEEAKKIKELQTSLIHMQKMVSLGILSAGIAHEINNPLSFLVSNLEFIAETIRKSGEGRQLSAENLSQLKEAIQEAQEGSLRIRNIVHEMRVFSHKSEGQRSPVDVNQVLESSLRVAWNELKYKAAVSKSYKITTEIEADPTQLSQVFLNILLNAVQAIAEKGTITLSTYEDSEKVYIEITDTGGGIPDEVLPKIFEPFFTTKKGTGLGLAVSYNIIKQHQGDIRIKSKVGEGSTFIVELPKHKARS